MFWLLVPPQMVILPQNKTVNKSYPVLLRCEASGGYPAPSITWAKDGRQLHGAQRTVTIGQSRKSDAARYVCTAHNGVGQPKTAEAYVTVQCKCRHVIDWQCHHVKRQVMAFLGIAHYWTLTFCLPTKRNRQFHRNVGITFFKALPL